MSSPTLRARRTALSLLLATLLALVLPGLNARADPTPTQIQTPQVMSRCRGSCWTVPDRVWAVGS